MDPAYLLNDRNILGPPANDRQEVKISLPENVDDLSDALFPLHRALLDSYRGLPWPRKMQKIVALTEVRGGRGDIAAAGKALGLMQKICPDLRFDWVLRGAKLEQYNPQAFLLCDDPSKISMRRWESDPTDGAAADFMLAGPVKLTSGVDYIASKIHRKIAGPTCAFAEIGEECSDLDTEIAQELVRKANEEKQPLETIYAQNKLHKRLFPSRSSNGRGLFPMGLQPGSGVFLEPSRIAAPLSRGYCCPSYLPQIEDAALRKDILEAMGVYDGASEPDYDQYSLNSGYAHRPVSWGKFIDFTAIHERNKHVAVVLNQHGEYDRLSTEEFAEQIFTPERLAYLKAQGYGTIILKGEEEQAFSLGQSENPEQERRLVVIVRKKFLPQDMRRLQLASERLLGTGDNSALEAWCARCKLYLYEDVANGGCKWRFLQQQVDLAKQFSPNLSRLLALFGGDRRTDGDSLNRPLTQDQMAEAERLLADPGLSDATLQMCDHIVSHYSFAEVLEGALKRTAWHHIIPDLAAVEAETLDDSFRNGIVSYLQDPAANRRELTVTTMIQLARQVQEIVQKRFSED